MTTPRLADDVLRFMQGIETEQVWLTVLGPGEAQTYDDVARLAWIEPIGKAWNEIKRAEGQAPLQVDVRAAESGISPTWR